MRVVAFCGPSGVGKTTLMEGVIAALRQAGQRVSVIKHTHKRFDIDQPGKDSFRHRQAGASEVLLASEQRLVKLREFEDGGAPDVHGLIGELAAVDWVLVEGFKHSDLPKVEVWREALAAAPLYVTDARVVAVATDRADRLPQPAHCPVLPMDDAATVAAWLLAVGERLHYEPSRNPHG